MDLPHRITPEDFPAIEAEMKKEIKANHVFEKVVVTREQAIKDSESGRLGGLGERPGNPSKFKLGNLAGHPRRASRSPTYKNGDFIDLCAGPHVMRTGNIGAFKLTSVASAYYKGDEKNPQLQRIYGTAFKNKTELEAYFKMLEEAKRATTARSARRWGSTRSTPNTSGPGLPLWLPKGRRDRRGTGEAGEGNGICGRLCARQDAAHGARRRCTALPATCPTTRSRCFRP